MTTECAETLSYEPGSDQATCRVGKRTCSGGAWGACVGSTTSFQSVPKAFLKSTTPSKCLTNPCDPGCMNYIDNGNDVDAGASFVVDETGGISLSVQEAGAVSNWEGGVIDGGTPCVAGELKCQIPPCSSSGGYLATKLSGAVYDPAGKNPIPNVLVFIPNKTVVIPTDGVNCDTCSAGTGDPIVSAVTDYKGEFTLNGVPAGANIPLVIKSGKWQRQLTIPSITACTTNNQTKGLAPATAPLIRFPKNRTEGSIPRIAFMSGNADPFECVLSKMGLDTTAATGEFSKPTTAAGALTAQRIHWYNSDKNAGKDLSSSNNGPGVAVTNLIDSLDRLKKYDAVILSCEGGDYTRTSAQYKNLVDYATLGGRIFATHFSYVWLEDQPAASQWPNTVVSWNHSGSYNDPLTTYIDRGFAKGENFAQWLKHVGASGTLGQLAVNEPRRDYTTVDATRAQRWMTAWSNNSPGTIASGQDCAVNSDCPSTGLSCAGSGFCQDGTACSGGPTNTCGKRTEMCSSAADCAGPHKACSTVTNNVCALTSKTAAPPAKTGSACTTTASCGDPGLVCAGSGMCQDGTACTSSTTCGTRTKLCTADGDCASAGDLCTTSASNVCAVRETATPGPLAGAGNACTTATAGAVGTCPNAGLKCAGAGVCQDGRSCTSSGACDPDGTMFCKVDGDCPGANRDCGSGTSNVCRFRTGPSTARKYWAGICDKTGSTGSGYCADNTPCTTDAECGLRTIRCGGSGDCLGDNTYCGDADDAQGGYTGLCRYTATGTQTGVCDSLTCQPKTCTVDSNCATGQVCTAGVCATPSYRVNKCDAGLCPDGTACSTDAQCASRTKTCTTKADCAGANTYCVPSTSAIGNGSGGSYSKICTVGGSVGVCDGMACAQKGCTIDADCGAGNYCAAGKCAAINYLVGKCNAGKCADGSSCAVDGDCGTRTTVCASAADCVGPNMACVQSNTSVQGYSSICTYTSGGSVAVGKCDGTTCSVNACVSDADCGADASCGAGVCKTKHNMEPLMTFNVPVGAAPAAQCGRVVFSDFHVSADALSGSSSFPASCNTGNLSAQEKALEYMLFDLTACLSPDYIPTGSTTKFTVPQSVTRDYTATCPVGYLPEWHFFDWLTTTPGDSKIEFYAQTGNTAAAMSAMTRVPLASVAGAPITSWTGVDVATKLAPTPSGSQLRVTIVLYPTSDGATSPTLNAWRQAYTCKATE